MPAEDRAQEKRPYVVGLANAGIAIGAQRVGQIALRHPAARSRSSQLRTRIAAPAPVAAKAAQLLINPLGPVPGFTMPPQVSAIAAGAFIDDALAVLWSLSRGDPRIVNRVGAEAA